MQLNSTTSTTSRPAVDLSWDDVGALWHPAADAEPDQAITRDATIVALVAENDALRETLQAAIARLAALTTQLERARTTIGHLLEDRRRPIGRAA